MDELTVPNNLRVTYQLARQESEAAARRATPELRLLSEIRELLLQLVSRQPPGQSLGLTPITINGAPLSWTTSTGALSGTPDGR